MPLQSFGMPHQVEPADASSPAPVFLLHTFGRFELVALSGHADARPILQRGKPLALLTFCAAERRRPHTRETLYALLWADAAPERARHNVRQALWRLRRVLGDLLVTRDDAVLSIAPPVATDREQFLEAVARQDHAAALAIYRGPFLEGLSLPGGDEFEDWVVSERARLEEALLRVVERAMRADPSPIRASDRRGCAEQLIERAPDSMEARRLAVELLLEAGDRVGARREAHALEALAERLMRPLQGSVQALVARTRQDDDAPSGEEPISLEMVGRDEPFALAMAAWAQVRRGTYRGLLFSGVAGVGKTRLLHAIAERCGRRGHRVMQVRANPGEQMMPWSHVVSLVRALVKLPGAAGISGESAAELAQLDPGVAAEFPLASAAARLSDPQEVARRRALALLDLLQAVVEQQPVALLLDDAHWMDHASGEALSFALTRMAALPLLVIAAARPGGASLERDGLDHHLLAPLEADAVLEAVRSAGTWPTGPEVDQFLHTLAMSCDGIPLHAIERLAMALESGILERRQGVWTSAQWMVATREIAQASPVTRRLRGCTEEERAALLVHAVAGAPLAHELFAGELPMQQALRSLEAKGVMRCERGHWMPTHDLIAEQVALDADHAMRTRAHRQLAEALVRSRMADRLAMAVRHFHLAGDNAAAGAAFAHVVGRARARGDGRTAQDLLADLVGDMDPGCASSIVAQVPWFHRVDRIGTRLMMVTGASLVLLAGAIAWRAWSMPVLQVEQTSLSTINAPSFGAEALRLVPAPILRVATASTLRRGMMVRVRALDRGTHIVAGDSVPVRDESARFGGLRVVSDDTIIRLQFEADGFRPAIMSVMNFTRPDGRRDPIDGAMHLLDGRFTVAGRTQFVRGDTARLIVPPNALLSGVVQVEYSAPWAAASVWIAMTPTWGEPRSEGQEIEPLTTPARSEVVDLRLSVRTPREPGRYWLLLVAGAEPSGGFLLSNSNWLSGTATWGDGNDVATLPDSVISAARRRGLVEMKVSYPARDRPTCPTGADPDLRYCVYERGLVAVEILVR
jgi:DNA-binding SARP family transcriptional activator